MIYLICSDIHGASDSAKFIINAYEKYNCKGIICLGDVLYHGPRNDLPENYSPKEVIKLLNPYASKILCVKGNCEAEVDQMVLDFEILDELNTNINGLNCHIEHGHHLDKYSGDADIILSGHTHVSGLKKKDKQIFINPGSITIPKENTKRSIIIWDDNVIKLVDINYKEEILYKY